MADIIAMFSKWAKSGLSAFLDGSSSSSSSSSVESTRGSALDDFQRIMRMLPRIEAVLEDAEESEIQYRSVKLWLSELRALACDIDDVIDEYEFNVLAAQMEARDAEESYHRGKRKRGDDERYDQDEQVECLNALASSSSQVPVISNGMVEKLREIRERFDEIERDRKGLRLREEDGVRRTINAQNSRLTSSLVDESSIIGRESEKEEIVKLLLSDLHVSNKITVIPIVGMGGVGKTTLAQLIYNDPRILRYFDLRIWIYVSEDFDLMKLTKEIYRSITNKSCEEDVGFDYLQDSIKKELMNFKRMFLVLDDVWNEKQCLWESLKVPFHNAGIVNILLTTRNEKVADVMRTMNYFRLGFLSEDDGWLLFQQYALCGDENLMRIGQKIVNKCGGLPLAIKLLGSHLRFERDEEAWMSILESELWDLDPGTNEIFPALKLSYQRLPIHLKPCFRYCSLFPKKRIPDKNHLVWLWMAQGYIQPKIRGKTMEEIGREYFDELLGRSFFQATESRIKMHDLVYDLAVSISDNDFIIMKSEGGNQNKCRSNNARHLAVHDEPTNNEALKGILAFPFLSSHVALRSIFCYGRRTINDFQLLDSTRLRVLYIEIYQFDSNLSKFLGSIASMKHLRYLCFRNYSLSGLHWLKVALSSLFNSLHSTGNVQVLDLSGCHNYPMMVPASIKNLINLRHLILPYGSIMPCGISKLTCLQTLKVVVIKDGNHEGGGLGEIEELASLTGSCCISNIDYANNVEDFKKANINGKKHFRRLFINWHDMAIYSNVFSFDVYISFDAMVRVEKQSFELEVGKLEALRPHTNLKELEIHNYPGILFPSWLGDPSYSKLQDITLKGCNKWDGSGRVLDRDLPCLQNISIIDCAMLKNIKIVQSSSLRTLVVKLCPKITSLHGICSLHRLEMLKIRWCYNILISAEEMLPSKLQFVCFEDCWELTSIPGLQKLRSLKELKLKRCWKLELTLEEKLSTMPSVLEIADCPRLEKWCQRYGFKYILAYVQQLENSRLKLTQLEQELQRARQQEIFISSTGDQSHSTGGNGLEHRYPSEHSSLFDNNAADGLVDTNEIDLAKAKPFPDIDCFDSLHLRIDQKDKATFNYVREILKRSGFSGSGFLGAWNSPYQPMDPLIFNEGEDLSHELDITEDEHDILLEHQLLVDLINEAWVKMYEKYCGYLFPWLSRFNTNNRPMPMGDHILKEIWTNICWHLKGQPEPDKTLDDIVSRDFTKNDGWMNIQYDSEDVELDLECLILDALLDDESPKELFVRSSKQNKLWLEEESVLFENICVLEYDGAILETEKWPAFQLLGFYICSCVHLKSLSLRKNFSRLKQLRIWDCSHLEELFGLDRVATLQDIDISNCPNLLFLSRFPKSLQSLAIDRCNKLRSLDCQEMNLSSLEISSCSTLKFINELRLSQASLCFLKISNCPELYLHNELLHMLNPNNVEISACPQLQKWCQKQSVAYI